MRATMVSVEDRRTRTNGGYDMLTLSEFRDTARRLAGQELIDATETDGIEDEGIVYEDGVYIEIGAGGEYFLTISNHSESADGEDGLKRLESILYEFWVDNCN